MQKCPYTQQYIEGLGLLDFFTIDLAGFAWRYTLVTKKQMAVANLSDDEECPGVCRPAQRIIYIKEDSIYHNVLIHELVHAFKDMTNTGTADMTADQTEEIFCEIFAYNWWQILRAANQMSYNLQSLYWVREGADPEDLQWGPPHGELSVELTELIDTYVENGHTTFKK